MSCIWVLGASGFVGQAVVNRLLIEGWKVKAVSSRERKETFSPCPLARGRLSLSVCPGYEDLTPEPEDFCVHLAESNVLSEGKLAAHYPDSLDLCKRIARAGFAWTVYASSAAVYGDSSPEPRRETDSPNPTSTYARRKLACEEALLGTNRATVLRLANVYGPGMSQLNVMSDIKKQLGGSAPVKLRSLTPVRDFVFIEDVADLVARVVKNPRPGVYNVGTGTGISVRSLAETIFRVYDSNTTTLEETRSTAGASSVLVLAVDRVREQFDWVPNTGLEEGLRKSI